MANHQNLDDILKPPPIFDQDEMDDEIANKNFLDEARDIVLNEDDGTGERLLWILEILQIKCYELIEKKKETFA